MKPALRELEGRYFAALGEFIDHADERPLLKAYELGRAALTQGMGVLELAEIHHRVLNARLEGELAPAGVAARLRAAEAFFMESLSPFEMVQRGYAEANSALRHFNEVLQEQARRIGQTLHADAGQLLATVYLHLAEAERAVPDAKPHMDKIRAYLDQMRDHLRDLAHELRPTMLDDLGLLPALTFLANNIGRRSGVDIEVIGNLQSRLPREVETAVYRIVQEALGNVERHSGAGHVQIEVAGDSSGTTCVVQDDGRGFDVEAVQSLRAHRGLGLTGIQERLATVNGTLQIDSQVGHGTRLRVFIPA